MAPRPAARTAGALLAALLLARVAAAQTITATVTGIVRDQSGGVLPGATVTATSADTGLEKTAVTEGEGRYVVPFLHPGTYTLTAALAGFAPATRAGVRLEVAQTVSLDFTLAVAGTAETVEVRGSAPLLVTQTSGLETTIETRLVEDLPSAERSALAFINLVPGTIDAGFARAAGEALNVNANAQGPIGSPGNRNFFDSNFAVNGGRASTNDVLIDGVSNTAGDFNGVAVSPPQDSVREIKVHSGSYPAEFGRSGGGVVSIVTRAGGRRLQGAAYEYLQLGDLNANGWQRNRAPRRADGSPGLPRVDYERHQFGAALGGPLPGLGRRSPRAFFFVNYEGRREDNPFSRELTLPTERMRRGDLSELLTGAVRPGVFNPDGSPALVGQVYDPFAPLVGGLRRPIPGNRLDLLPVCGPGPRRSACLDPVALNLLAMLPLPNRPGLADNYVFSGTARFTRNIGAVRVDATPSDAQNLFGRFSYERRFQAEPDFLGSPATNARRVRDTFFNFTVNHVYTLSPRVINNVRYGHTHLRANQIPNSFGFDPTSLGLPAYLRDGAAALKFPDFNFATAGPPGLGLPGEITSGQIGGAGNNQPRNTYTVADAVTILLGRHTVKTGGEYRLYTFDAFQYFTPTGSFTFSRIFTRGPNPALAPANAAETGSSLASLLLGLPSGGDRQTVTPLALDHHYGALFVQDDWQVHPDLTLNLGLRWDIETGTAEKQGLITNFDLDAPSHLAGRVPMPTDPFVRELRPDFTDLRGLLQFVDGPQTRANRNRFAPRFGFAYRIDDRTTLRGGYGLFYVPLSLEPPTAQGNDFRTALLQSPQTGQVVQPGTGAQPTVFLSDPFPAGFPPAPGRSLGPDTLIGQSIFAVEPERPTAYNQQWNLVLQREIADGMAIDIAYVGSKGVRLPIQTANLNQLPPAYLDYALQNYARAGVTSPTAFFNQQVPNPFFGVITNPNSALRLPTVTRLQLLRPFPQYEAVGLFRPHWGLSRYDAFQINFTRRFRDGLSATANYTRSRLRDTGGVGNGAAFLDATAIENIYEFREGEYSLSTLDVPHRFVASWSYELPFGRGRRWGAGWPRALDAVLGGWQTAGMLVWQSGTPVQIIASPFPVAIGNAVRRPDRVPGVDARLPGDEARRNARAGQPWFNTAAFAFPGDFRFGNAARTYDDVRRDSYKNVNLSVLKNFVRGRHKLQLRGELLNAFNMVVFGTPGRDVTQPATFGIVRTQGNTPRIVQFVVRYTF
jgi:outer membrane receptor protein involved in Fe transport